MQGLSLSCTLGANSYPDHGVAMDNVDDKLWAAFRHLAEQYPDDQGVRMTSDLARWLTEERQRVAALSDGTAEPSTSSAAKSWKKPWDK